jgi:hypothetical protein
VLIGIGLSEIIKQYIPKSTKILLMLIPLVIFIISLTFFHERVQLHNDFSAYSYAQFVLKSMPRNAIVFTDHDDEYFPLQYFQLVKEKRPDIAIIASTLLPNKWYFDQIQRINPALELAEYDEILDNFIQTYDIQSMTNDEQTKKFVDEAVKSIIKLNPNRRSFVINANVSDITNYSVSILKELS